MTHTPLSQIGIPNAVQVYPFIQQADGSHKIGVMRIQIVRDGEGVWREHFNDDNGTIIDVAIIILDEIWDTLSLPALPIAISAIQGGQMALNEIKGEKTLVHVYPQVGADVFILGYPHGLPLQGVLPIWKRGSLATELLIPSLNTRNVFLIDSATRSGMSGSPVLYFGDSVVSAADGKRLAWPENPLCIGIYGGREGSSNDELAIQLARAWKISAVEELLYSGNWKSGEYFGP